MINNKRFQNTQKNKPNENYHGDILVNQTNLYIFALLFKQVILRRCYLEQCCGVNIV